MGTSENNQHLLHSPDREGLAVEQMLCMLPQVCPAWYDSIDLDADRHWALLKPTFRGPEAEIKYRLRPASPVGYCRSALPDDDSTKREISSRNKGPAGGASSPA